MLTGDISTDTLREIARHGCVHLNKPVKAQAVDPPYQRLLAEARPPQPQARPQLELPASSGKSSTVFVVDDDAAVREATRDLLGENGYSVEIFADGEAFLRADRSGGVPAGRCPDAGHVWSGADRAA